MKRSSPSHVTVVVESMPKAMMPLYRRHAETGQVPAGITDVLTIGEDATLLRPVQRALRPRGWAVAGVTNMEAAIAYLRSSVAAVAVVEAELSGTEVILVTWNELPLQEAVEAGAFDLVQRPFDHSNLLLGGSNGSAQLDDTPRARNQGWAVFRRMNWGCSRHSGTLELSSRTDRILTRALASVLWVVLVGSLVTGVLSMN